MQTKTDAPKPESESHAEEAKPAELKKSFADTLSLLLIALMFVLGIAYYPSLPGEIIAYVGAQDSGIAPKYFGLFSVPIAGTLLYIILTYIPPILIAQGKKIPKRTLELVRPAALAYFAYTQAEIIAFNTAEIQFTPAQDMAAVIGIGIACASAAISGAKGNLFPAYIRHAGDSSIMEFNKNLGKLLAGWAALVLLGFFAARYIPLMIIIPGVFVMAKAAYDAHTLSKASEIKTIRSGIEGDKAGKPETSTDEARP